MSHSPNYIISCTELTTAQVILWAKDVFHKMMSLAMEFLSSVVLQRGQSPCHFIWLVEFVFPCGIWVQRSVSYWTLKKKYQLLRKKNDEMRKKEKDKVYAIIIQIRLDQIRSDNGVPDKLLVSAFQQIIDFFDFLGPQFS